MIARHESHRIIEGTAFGPEVLRVVRAAFDEAWSEIEARFPSDMHTEARRSLSAAVMSASRDDSSDSGPIRDAGVRAMKRGYPQFFTIDANDAPRARDV